MKNNVLFSAVLIKGISLGLFGVGIIAGFLQIVKGYDQYLKDDDWSIAYISITWFAYIFAKTYVECKSVKNYRNSGSDGRTMGNPLDL
jgi:hypothetical protein